MQAAAAGMAAAASPAAPWMWIALITAAATLAAWVIGRPGPARVWPRIGFGLALLALCVALGVQLAVDLGSGSSSLQIRMRPSGNPVPPVGMRTMVACYAAALAASAWGAWRLLRRR